MKNSRFFVIITMMMVALFSGGATLGSLFPKTNIYVVITVAAIALAIYGLWFYHGHKKENVEKKNSKDDQSSEKE